MKKLATTAVLFVAGVFLTGQIVGKRYKDNGNGTVSDPKTGLMWQQKDDGVPRTWDEAKAYCENLALAGQGDWRLPNKEELLSIIDYGRVNPAIDMGCFPGTKSSFYWSSSAYVEPHSKTTVWAVAFGYGGIYGNISYSAEKRGWPLKGLYKTSCTYVRCVR